MSEKETVFVDGMIVKKPHENAPDFVKAGVSFKVSEMIKFLQDNDKDGWVNAQLKESKAGKLYMELDTWKPEKKEDDAVPSDEVSKKDLPWEDLPW